MIDDLSTLSLLQTFLAPKNGHPTLLSVAVVEASESEVYPPLFSPLTILGSSTPAPVPLFSIYTVLLERPVLGDSSCLSLISVFLSPPVEDVSESEV